MWACLARATTCDVITFHAGKKALQSMPEIFSVIYKKKETHWSPW